MRISTASASDRPRRFRCRMSWSQRLIVYADVDLLPAALTLGLGAECSSTAGRRKPARRSASRGASPPVGVPRFQSSCLGQVSYGADATRDRILGERGFEQQVRTLSAADHADRVDDRPAERRTIEEQAFERHGLVEHRVHEPIRTRRDRDPERPYMA